MADEARRLGERLSRIYLSHGDFSNWRLNSEINPCAEIDYTIATEWGEGAKERFEAILDEIEPRLEDSASAPFWGRTGEQTVRIATIAAIGMGSLTVGLEELEWAFRLAKNSALFMMEGATAHMAASEHQATLNKIMEVVKDGEKRGKRRVKGRVSYRHICRTVQTIKARDLRDALQQLCDAGQLVRFRVNQDRGGHPVETYQLPSV
ncbi:MAG: hypothetical protein AAGG69_11620 [Pseudomonadota bacterium]